MKIIKLVPSIDLLPLEPKIRIVCVCRYTHFIAAAAVDFHLTETFIAAAAIDFSSD